MITPDPAFFKTHLKNCAIAKVDKTRSSHVRAIMAGTSTIGKRRRTLGIEIFSSPACRFVSLTRQRRDGVLASRDFGYNENATQIGCFGVCPSAKVGGSPPTAGGSATTARKNSGLASPFFYLIGNRTAVLFKRNVLD